MFIKTFAIKIFYLKQELSQTTTNLRIFSIIIENKFKENTRKISTKS